MGIEKERCRLEWISASEGDKVKSVINDMVEKIRKLGPLSIPKKLKKFDEEIRVIETIANREEELEHA
jgi:F420-non-reducing hydrogenase iron-sulfur subunit